MMKDWLSVGEIGKKTGLSHKALRIYEEKGLLVPHTRSEGQHRVYTTAILKSLWPKEYLAALERWENKHKMWWMEFGVPMKDGAIHLKA